MAAATVASASANWAALRIAGVTRGARVPPANPSVAMAPTVDAPTVVPSSADVAGSRPLAVAALVAAPAIGPSNGPAIRGPADAAATTAPAVTAPALIAATAPNIRPLSGTLLPTSSRAAR